MNEKIVANSGPVTLIGAGQANIEELSEALIIAPFCVAVDGGADFAVKSGLNLEALIGDFDSVAADTLSKIPPDRQFKISEQETTDFDKALRSVTAPLVIGVGFCGGRIDHQLAAFHTLARHAHRPCILLADSQIVLLAPPRIALPTVAGDIVSIFPLGPVSGRSTGLKWPIDQLPFDPLTQIGTSNQATGPLMISMAEPSALLILPKRLIRPVADALSRSDAVGWPPRAGQYKAPQPS